MNKSSQKTRSVKTKKRTRSDRSRAFLLFEFGWRPSEVADVLQAKFSTICRYHSQWKKLPSLFHGKYQYAKKIYRKLSRHDRGIIADVLAHEIGTTKVFVLAKMQEPWGIRQMVTGEWREWAEPDKKPRRFAKLRNPLTKIQLMMAPVEVKTIIEFALNPDIETIDDEYQDEDG